MYTQCPECATVFRVTAPVLRIAQGQVRCGVCDTSFDALRYLSDDVELDVNAASASRIAGAPAERPAPPPPPPAPAAPAAGFGAATRHRPSADEERELGAIAAELARGAARTAGAAPPASAPVSARAAEAAPERAPAPAPAPRPAEPEENVLEPTDIEDIVLEAAPEPDIPDAELEFNLPADSWDQVFVKDPTATVTPLDLDLAASRASAEPFEAPDELTILESGEDALARTDEFPQPDFTEVELELEPPGPDGPPEPEAPAALEASADTEPEVAPEPPPPLPFFPGAARAAPPATPVAPPDVDFRERAPAAESEPGAAPPAGRRIAAMAAAVALVLALVAQIVNHYREALAESPMLGPALTALYARFGLPLEPNWDLTAFDVRQWGAQSEEVAGVLTLRASIVNKAPRGQPYPLLRVTLEDRFGSRVGRREFTPAEYLPGRAQPRALLGSGARADADLKLADPGNQAVGFELDVCLARHGVLLCGADAKAGT